MKKKLALITLTAAVGAAAFTAIGTAPRTVEAETTQVSQQTAADAANRKEKLPKYIFLFIGDGMSYPQIQLTNYYLSAQNQQGAKTVQAGDVTICPPGTGHGITNRTDEVVEVIAVIVND